MKAILTAFLLALAGIASAGDNEQAPSVLGCLEAQNHVIDLYAGPQPLYTVLTKDGKVLANRITAAALRARFPELSRINDATAVAWAGL